MTNRKTSEENTTIAFADIDFNKPIEAIGFREGFKDKNKSFKLNSMGFTQMSYNIKVTFTEDIKGY